MTSVLLAANPAPWWGEISPPPGVEKFVTDVPGGGLIILLNNLLRLLFTLAGLFAFFNLILAGFQFMTAGGDPKAVGTAWGKIWRSLLGLIIIVSSFVLAAVFGWILFGDPTAILNPKLRGFQ